MANSSDLLSTTSSFLEDIVTSHKNNTDNFIEWNFRDGLTTNVWRYVWPLLCVTGLVGNTLVLLVLKREGLLRTSANVYLTAMAIGDNLVLIIASVAAYPFFTWGFMLGDTSIWACRVILPAHYTLLNASIWVIVAFTAERCVAVRCPLLKLRLCTPNKAGLCCVALLVVAVVKNIDLFFLLDLTTNPMGDVVCRVRKRYYTIYYRPWINLVLIIVLPLCIVLVGNYAIIRKLRRTLTATTVRNSARRTTLMCLGVSFAFVVCVVPSNLFIFFEHDLPMTHRTRYVAISFVMFLRYVNHAINFFLYSLTGAHFRSELIALFHRCIQRGRTAAAVVRGMLSCVARRFNFRRSVGDDLQMRELGG